VRIAVTALQPGPDSSVARALDRAPYLVVYDTATGTWQALDNRPVRKVSGCPADAAAELLERHRVDVLLTGTYGPAAYRALQDRFIRVRDGAAGTVRHAVSRFLQPAKATRHHHFQ